MKNNKATTVGALVLGGLLFRPLASFTTPSGETGSPATPEPGGQSSAPRSTGEGPWLASCRYWAPARLNAGESEQDTSVSSTFSQSGNDVNLMVSASGSEDKSACPPDDKWGIPKTIGEYRPNITAIIATVTDPVHTNMALQFDRTVDAIEQAAADNGYVSSYFWLPWRRQRGVAMALDSKDGMEPGHDPKRERQPGLVIFKYVSPDKGDLSNSYYQVIYLFLVAETPTLGVNGTQMRNALQYEADLKSQNGAKLSFDSSYERSIVGPQSSASAASLLQSIVASKMPGISKVQITGAPSTEFAATLLNSTSQARFLSFGDNSKFEQDKFDEIAKGSGYDVARMFVLIEDNTTFGKADRCEDDNSQTSRNTACRSNPHVIRFPREISLLRNAHVDDEQSGREAATSGSLPSPYLHLSLRDMGLLDDVPDFSHMHTPLSQEAQLITIARQLQRYRAQFVEIIASDILDAYFLAQFLHRACPDARLVFYGGDLLFERESENVPFVGAITVSPYSLISLENTSEAYRAYPDASSEEYYNAASYTLWNRDPKTGPALAGYGNNVNDLHPSLWATTVGLDGYYPLAILNRCASDSDTILPSFVAGDRKPKACKDPPTEINFSSNGLHAHPSLLWSGLCIAILLLAAVHAVLLFFAKPFSPFTCDLAIGENDQPIRRSMYVNIGAVMLFCMAFVVAWPLFFASPLVPLDFAHVTISVVTILAGIAAVVCTLWKAGRHIWWQREENGRAASSSALRYFLSRLEGNIYFVFNGVAWLTAPGVMILWTWRCAINGPQSGDSPAYMGLFFSYRCLNPGSGVSPVIPILFLLFSWYLWALFQTWRLRFSDKHRPMLPKRIPMQKEGIRDARLFFVSDEEIQTPEKSENSDDRFGASQVDKSIKAPEVNESPYSGDLFKNITSLLITRRVIHRFLKLNGQAVDLGIAGIYAAVFFLFALFCPFQSIGRFLWRYSVVSTPFEFLIAALFFPLLVIMIAGCLRMVLIWGSLRRSLLTALERQPFRRAFDRIERVNLMNMFRQGGMREQWLDMARSTESIRQMVHDPDLLNAVGMKDDTKQALIAVKDELDRNTEEILNPPMCGPVRPSYKIVHCIEMHYAEFCAILLSRLLIPYWREQRTGPVESEAASTVPLKAKHPLARTEDPNGPIELHASAACNDPLPIQIAEEFLAIRYLSLIRAVLVNMRYQMIFVSSAFVLAIVAWNSYPFQPRKNVDWFFTALLFVSGTAIVTILVQAYRDPILSRINNKAANELGVEFYVRILSFGTVPVLTWLAYQFPDIGNAILKFIQPGLSVLK